MVKPIYNLFHENYLRQDYKLVNLINCVIKCHYGKYQVNDYAECYRILGIPLNSDQECVRKAFIDLCKKYHPDSGNLTADPTKFQEIESAYRCLQSKFAEERWNINEGVGEYGLYYNEKKNRGAGEQPEVFDIKHTAPQHRQYLSFNGIGSGTPSQREKQFNKYKTVIAAENIYDHQIKKLSQGNGNSEASLVIKDKAQAGKVKTRYGMDRLVEDLIQESMAKGHFDNLKGQGKPLPHSNFNPYVDFVTHKVNEILIDNGFAPEWITLQKEITDETQVIREKLIKEREKLGSFPLSVAEERKWQKAVADIKAGVQLLNQKINAYNLIVPILKKQKLYFNLEKESSDILKSGKHYRRQVGIVEEIKGDTSEAKGDLLSSLLSLFK